MIRLIKQCSEIEHFKMTIIHAEQKNINFYCIEIQHVVKTVPDFLLFGRDFCQYYSCAHTENRV